MVGSTLGTNGTLLWKDAIQSVFYRSLKCDQLTFNGISCSENNSNNSWNCNLNRNRVNCNWNNKNNTNRIVPFYDSAIRIIFNMLWIICVPPIHSKISVLQNRYSMFIGTIFTMGEFYYYFTFVLHTDIIIFKKQIFFKWYYLFHIHASFQLRI